MHNASATAKNAQVTQTALNANRTFTLTELPVFNVIHQIREIVHSVD